MGQGPLVAQVWLGLNAVHVVRTMLGGTDPLRAQPGTIRGDLALHVGRNVCHASDSVHNAEKEILLWFGDEPQHDSRRVVDELIYRETDFQPTGFS